MSVVTNAILSFSIMDEDRISSKMLNAWSPFNDNDGFVSCDDTAHVPAAWYGGTKMLETPLYVGALNHFIYTDYMNYLRSLPWRFPEHVQLMIKGQWDDRFSIVTFADVPDPDRLPEGL